MFRATVYVLVMAIFWVVPGWGLDAGDGDGREIRHVAADHEVLEAMLQEHGVELTPPSPALNDWITTLIDVLMRWMDERLPEDKTWLKAVLMWAMWSVVGVVALLVVLALVVAIRSFKRRSLLTSEDENSADLDGEDPELQLVRREPEQCWIEFEGALRAGRTHQATQALWWWLALTVAGDSVEASWTSGDLLRFSRRFRELGPALALLDSIVYGGAHCEPGMLRGLADGLREAV